MTNDELLATMLKDGYIKADILHRLHLLREYFELKFFTPQSATSLAQFLEHPDINKRDKMALSGYGKAFFGHFTAQNAYTVLEAIGESVKALPTVNVYTPVPLPDEETDRVGIWFRKNLHPMVLVELHEDPSTFGGCAFAWEGVYYDYSLTYHMKKKIPEIRKILTNYQ